MTPLPASPDPARRRRLPSLHLVAGIYCGTWRMEERDGGPYRRVCSACGSVQYWVRPWRDVPGGWW